MRNKVMIPENEVIGIPSEEKSKCPNCGKNAAVIDRAGDKITTCCINCGATIRK